MRIALLTDGVHPYVIGGMQKHSYYLVRELARNGHIVYLYHFNDSKFDANKLELFSEAEKKNIKATLLSFPQKKHYPLHYISESYKYSESIYEAIQPTINEVDFIFAQGFCAWALLKQRKSKTPPVAVHFHGLEMFQNIPSLKVKLSRFFLQKAVKENLQKTDYAISYGGKITTILNGITDKNKIWEVPAGIEKNWLAKEVSPVADKVRFAFVGRYERRKGIPELNEAIKALSTNTNFTFDFIGDIPKENQLPYPFTKYHGKISSEAEIKKILSGSDVLVCPSYAEGMPNVIMEAMACGLAVIATDVGAVSLLVNNQNGYLLSAPTKENISEAMKSIIGNTKELHSLKQNSLIKIKEKYLLEDVMEKFMLKIGTILKH